MTAERLREAAALMRARAAVGGPNDYPSPWSASLDDHYHDTYEVLCHEDGSGLVADGLDRDLAEHIASWNPVVALAVADLLEDLAGAHDAAVAWNRERDEDDEIAWAREPAALPDLTDALAVADAYLGVQP